MLLLNHSLHHYSKVEKPFGMRHLMKAYHGIGNRSQEVPVLPAPVLRRACRHRVDWNSVRPLVNLVGRVIGETRATPHEHLGFANNRDGRSLFYTTGVSGDRHHRYTSHQD